MSAQGTCVAQACERRRAEFCRRACFPVGAAGTRRLCAALRVLFPCPDRAGREAKNCWRGWAWNRRTRSRNSCRWRWPMNAVHSPSLEGFLDWVAARLVEIKRDMEHGRDEVRVMTVHGAKGLEADIVILPDTTSLPDPPSRKGHLLYDEDGCCFPWPTTRRRQIVKQAKARAEAETLREHRRLLYVALTRARDRLYVCGFENKNGVKDGSWYELARAAAESLGVAGDAAMAKSSAYGQSHDEKGAAAARWPAVAAKPCPAGSCARAGRTCCAATDPPVGCGGRDPARISRPCAARTASAAEWSCMRFWRGCRRSQPDATPRGGDGFRAEAKRSRSSPKGWWRKHLPCWTIRHFAAAFAPGSQAEVGLRGGAAGTGSRRARQWPHRPAGGDRQESPDPGLQDQPPAARA